MINLNNIVRPLCIIFDKSKARIVYNQTLEPFVKKAFISFGSSGTRSDSGGDYLYSGLGPDKT
jgi:hypothetical protein